MTNISALATREILHIVQPTREVMRLIMTDEAEVQLCAPSEELGKLFVKAHIYNFAECADCHVICTPNYYSGTGKNIDPLCRQCANDAYGH